MTLIVNASDLAAVTAHMLRGGRAPDGDGARTLTYVPLTALRPATRNARHHSPEQVALIAGLIDRFGFTSPCLIDERTQLLVAGHGRVEALHHLLAGPGGDQHAPGGVLVDEDDGGWLVPVLRGWSSADDAEAEAMIVADNKASDEGDWHQQSLAAILENLHADDPGWLDVLGFDEHDMDEVIRRAAEPSLDGQGDTPYLPDGGGGGGGDDGEIGEDPALRGGGPRRDERDVQCPQCHHTFTPGDRAWD